MGLGNLIAQREDTQWKYHTQFTIKSSECNANYKGHLITIRKILSWSRSADEPLRYIVLAMRSQTSISLSKYCSKHVILFSNSQAQRMF